MSIPPGVQIGEYFVLLALAEAPSHGYIIYDQIIGDSAGEIYLRPSTLYFTLKSLEKSDLIVQSGNPSQKTGRNTYRLTVKGKRQLAAAAQMHERAARLAKSRLV